MYQKTPATCRGGRDLRGSTCRLPRCRVGRFLVGIPADKHADVHGKVSTLMNLLCLSDAEVELPISIFQSGLPANH